MPLFSLQHMHILLLIFIFLIFNFLDFYLSPKQASFRLNMLFLDSSFLLLKNIYFIKLETSLWFASLNFGRLLLEFLKSLLLFCQNIMFLKETQDHFASLFSLLFVHGDNCCDDNWSHLKVNEYFFRPLFWNWNSLFFSTVCK